MSPLNLVYKESYRLQLHIWWGIFSGFDLAWTFWVDENEQDKGIALIWGSGSLLMWHTYLGPLNKCRVKTGQLGIGRSFLEDNILLPFKTRVNDFCYQDVLQIRFLRVAGPSSIRMQSKCLPKSPSFTWCGQYCMPANPASNLVWPRYWILIFKINKEW